MLLRRGAHAPRRARAQQVDAFWAYALGLPEVIEVLRVALADDFLVHVGLPDMDGLRDFVLDRLTVRPRSLTSRAT